MAERVKRAVPALVVGLLAGVLAAVGAARPVGALPIGTSMVMAVNVQPSSMVSGPDGNLWFTNPENQTIGRVTPAGALTFVTDARIRYPEAMTAGPDGNLWFANKADAPAIVRLTPAGELTIFPAGQVTAMTAGPDGRLWYFTEHSNDVHAMTVDGVVSTYAVGGPVTGAVLNVVNGPDGNLWYSNGVDDVLSRVTTAGLVLPPIADPALVDPRALAVGPDGNVWFASRTVARAGRVTPAGVVTAFDLPTPAGSLSAGADGNLWFSPSSVVSTRVGRLTPGGVTTMFTVGAATRTLTLGPDGNVWFSTTDHVGRITPGGAVATFANEAVAGPSQITFGPDGNLWYTNKRNGTIARITTAGVATRFTAAGIDKPADITTGPDGNLWFTAVGAIGRITPDGAITTFSGPGVQSPYGITVGSDGNLWFTDPPANAIGRITTAGEITTFTDPLVAQPLGITTSPGGDVWFTSQGNNGIGRITSTGAITVVASIVQKPGPIVAAPDGLLYVGSQIASTLVRFDPVQSQVTGFNTEEPTDLAIGPDGHVWYTTRTGRVVRLDPATGMEPVHVAWIDGQANTSLAFAPGAVWVAQFRQDSIRAVGIAPPAPPAAPTAVTVTAGNATAELDWIAPADTGDAPITAYVITPSIDGVAQPPTVQLGTATAATVAGLVNGTTYTFTVTARSDVGDGPPSVPSAPVTPLRFPDVPVGAPFAADITWLVDHEITTGYPDGSFQPTASVSRQAAAAWLFRDVIGPHATPPACGTSFADVPPGAPFCGHITWAVTNGIASGFPDGDFHPAAAVSRQALAAFLYRAAGSPLGAHPICGAAAFTDVPAAAPYCGEIAWLAAHGIASGYEDGSFRPTAPVSRQAAAAFLHRFDAVLHP